MQYASSPTFLVIDSTGSRRKLGRYPDITHSRQCQYPVPDWDLAYALTKEPYDHTQIFRFGGGTRF